MDETMNNDTGSTDWTNDVTFTVNGTDSNYGTTLTFANTTFSFTDDYSQWPKGVQDPATEFKYNPKWHIDLGYKNQFKTMWN